MVNRETGTAVLPRRDPRGGRTAEGIEASAALLERLLWPIDAGSETEAGMRLLQLALDETRQPRGVLGTFDPIGRWSVLARCDRHAPAAEVSVPDAVLEQARTASTPCTAGCWLIVPLGPAPAEVLMLGGALPDGTPSRSALRLVRAIGELIHSRLASLRKLGDLEQEMRRLRLLRSPAHATIHCSIRLNPLLERLRESGLHRRPVLIVGEDGTEKEDLAHYLHVQGTTRDGPFVPFYPAALPAHGIEDALLGTPEADGALHRARGGTLYIEGPDHLPARVQARLLRALTEGVYERGAEAVSPELRIVTSVTGRRAALLEDLLQVLSDTEITVPPLRGHSEDINSLTELVLSEMGPGPDGRPRMLTPAARRRLLDHPWTGNLRELRTVMENAAARSGSRPISERHLSDELRTIDSVEERGLARLADVERRHIHRVLHAVGGRRARAAQVLGIATSTLYEKLKRFGIEG